MMEASGLETGERIYVWIFMVIASGIMLGAILLARHNLRQGRGDRRGALRAGLFVWITGSAGWLLYASHVPSLAEFSIVGTALWDTAFMAALVWLSYLALEPLARRWWPATLISWSRLLAGRFRDPMIGRDILIGGLLGVAMNLVEGLEHASYRWLGEPQSLSSYLPTESLLGGRHVISHLLQAPFAAVVAPIMYLFFLLLLRIVLRKMWLAVLVFYAVILSSVLLNTEQNMLVGAAWAVVYFAIMLFLVIRLGLLAFCFAVLVGMATAGLQFGTWYSGGDYATLIAALALVAYGFWISLAGRPLFREQLLE
jgi:serine/threonine-protein kinase